jgi:hypothetical protein
MFILAEEDIRDLEKQSTFELTEQAFVYEEGLVEALLREIYRILKDRGEARCLIGRQIKLEPAGLN